MALATHDHGPHSENQAGAQTHGARLEGGDKGAIVKRAPRVTRGEVLERNHLGVRERVGRAVHHVPATPDDLAVNHHDGTDSEIAAISCQGGLRKRLSHVDMDVVRLHGGLLSGTSGGNSAVECPS